MSANLSDPNSGQSPLSLLDVTNLQPEQMEQKVDLEDYIRLQSALQQEQRAALATVHGHYRALLADRDDQLAALQRQLSQLAAASSWLERRERSQQIDTIVAQMKCDQSRAVAEQKQRQRQSLLALCQLKSRNDSLERQMATMADKYSQLEQLCEQLQSSSASNESRLRLCNDKLCQHMSQMRAKETRIDRLCSENHGLRIQRKSLVSRLQHGAKSVQTYSGHRRMQYYHCGTCKHLTSQLANTDRMLSTIKDTYARQLAALKELLLKFGSEARSAVNQLISSDSAEVVDTDHHATLKEFERKEKTFLSTLEQISSRKVTSDHSDQTKHELGETT